MSKAQTKKTEKLSTQVAIAANSALDFGGRFKIVKQVTLPTFKIVEGVPMAFRVDGAMFVGKKLKADTDAKREPAHILPVTNLDTGEVGQIIVGAVLRGNLEEGYPNAEYVGLSFAILKGVKREGKRYNEYQIMQIEAA